jgi:hypothetical protein
MTSSRIEVRVSWPQSRKPSAPSGRDDDVIALLLQRVLQETLDVRVVVDDEDLGCHLTSRAHVRGAGVDRSHPGVAIIGPRPSSR